MAYLDGYYLNNPHIWQYDGSTWAKANCTPATGANQLVATSGGRIIRTGAQVRSLVLRREESSPADPGWSQYDLALAMKRVYPSQPYAIRNGFGWDALVKDHAAGYYLAAQGDSDQFTNPKCSGAFDGDHCIGVHPATRRNPDTGREQWWTDDPICPTGHWQDREAIYRYARKLGDKYKVDMFYGHLSKPVPKQVTLWGADVPTYLTRFNPTGWTVGQAIKEVNGGFGSVINMSDITLALDNIGHDYGARVDPSDLQVLVDHVK